MIAWSSFPFPATTDKYGLLTLPICCHHPFLTTVTIPHLQTPISTFKSDIPSHIPHGIILTPFLSSVFCLAGCHSCPSDFLSMGQLARHSLLHMASFFCPYGPTENPHIAPVHTTFFP
ncbi:hypothetical protein COLO4_17586 [Corchorus olitorius]|uniref:C2H2-type domain-containing protein n=1 Tax=Corchorus olitorius TaxID=93759 RepID=A0A1R3JC44_9ROSI|nr:hypothetical protein COLO4_17586 [Corchorus olitorius]